MNQELKMSENMSRIIDKMEITDNGEHKYVYCEGSNFIIGDVLFIIIAKLKEGFTFNYIAEFLKKEINVNASAEQVYSIITKHVATLYKPKENSYHDSIKFKIKLLTKDKLKYITENLTFLFNSKVFNVLFPFSLLVTFTYVVYSLTLNFTSLALINNFNTILLDYQNARSNSLIIIVGIYCIIPPILLFHEIGHATASQKYGKVANEVGFGFYLIFPVLYADVSRIWALNKQKRIVVNLGGVYFQLLCNIVIILILLFQLPGQSLWNSIFIFNTFILIFSLNPFLKNDGYWIYSDLFETPNLLKRAYSLPFDLFRKYMNSEGVKDVTKFTRKDIPLFIYSILNYIFITWGLYYFVCYLKASINELKIVAHNILLSGLDTDKLLFLIRFTFVILLTLYIIYTRSKNYARFIINKLRLKLK